MALKTVKVKIGIDNINKLNLGTPTTAGVNTLTIGQGGDIDHFEIADQWEAGAPDDKWADLHNSAGPAGVVDPTVVKQITITGPKDDIEKLYRAILLRDLLKGDIDASYEQNKIRFILNHLQLDESGVNADIDNATKVWKIAEASFEDYNDNKRNIINISAEKIFSKDVGANETSFWDELQALFILEKLLLDVRIKYDNDKFENGPEMFLPEDIGTDINELKEYAHGTVLGVTVLKVNTNIKHRIYDDLKDGGSSIYKSEIDKWIKHLDEMKTWQSYGLTKKSEIAKALKNGFTLADNTEIKAYGGQPLYKGFPIADPEQKCTEDPGADKTKPFVVSPSARYTKTKIGDFRKHFNCWQAKDTESGTLKFTYSDPQDLYGFQPGDIDSSGNLVTTLGAHGYKMSDKSDATKNDYLTRRQAQIMTEKTDITKIIDLAFFGHKFDELAMGTKVNKSDGSGGKMEWTIDSKEKLLDLYLGKDFFNSGVFYHEKSVGNTNLFDVVDFDAVPVDETKPGGEVKFGYNLIKGFLPIITRDYDSLDKTKDKTLLETAQNTLKKFQTAGNDGTNKTGEGLIGRTWKDEIQQKLADISDVLSGNKKKLASNVKIRTFVFSGSPDAIGMKIIAAAVKAKLLEIELNDLKALVDKLKEANGTSFKPNKVTKDLIESFATATDADDDGKKKKRIWDIVNDSSVKEKDSDAETWAMKGRNKAKEYIDDQGASLQAAQNALKAALGGDNENWRKVNDKLKSNTTVEVWQKAKKIYELAKKVNEGKDSTNAGELSSLRTNNTLAWDAINEIKHNGGGYADEALKTLEKAKKDLEKLNKEGKNIAKDGDENKVATFLTEAEQNLGDDKRVKERFAKLKVRLPLVAKLNRLGTDEAKKLAKILHKDILKYNSKTEKTTKHKKSHLERLREMESDLKAFQSSTDGDKKAAYTADPKIAEVVTSLLGEIKAQKELLEKGEEHEEDKNKDEKEKFWTSPWGITTIIAIGAAILGAIVYFIKTSSNEEGE